MLRIARYAALCALLSILSIQARADSNGWRVVEAEGQVEMSTTGGGFVPASLSNELLPGTVLRTGDKGRAVIENNGDRITVAPGSVFELPAQEAGTMTHVQQTVGTALYDMVPRGVDRFRVDTPYLAAVIKGTVFTVSVTSDGAAVEVLRGIVQVSNGEGQFPTLVHPGETATVGATAKGEIRLLGHPTAPGSKPATPPAQKPTTDNTTQHAGLTIEHTVTPHAVAIGTLTDGLVTKVDAHAGKNGNGTANGSNAQGNQTVTAAGSATTTDSGSAAAPVQTAALPGDGSDSTSIASAVDGITSGSSSSGNGNDGDGNGSGNSNGNNGNHNGAANGLGSGIGNGNGNNGNGLGNGGAGASVGSSVSGSPVTNLATTVATGSSDNKGNGNGNNGNGNGNGGSGNNGKGNGNSGNGNNGNGNGNGNGKSK